VDEVTGLNLKLDAKNCILRFGARHVHNSKEPSLHGGVIVFLDKAKYLAVMWKVGRNFGVDMQYMKSNFYCSFNSVFHRVARFHNELVVLGLQLVTTFVNLIYYTARTECFDLSITQLRSIEHTWLCAISRIFHINRIVTLNWLVISQQRFHSLICCSPGECSFYMGLDILIMPWCS